MLSAQYLLTSLLESTSISIKFLFLCPPLKKGGILRCTCRSVSLLIVCRPSDVRSIFFYHSAGKLPNLVQWMPLESRCSLFIFWSSFQRWRSNCWSSSYMYVVYSIYYYRLMVTKLATHLLTLERWLSVLLLGSHGQVQATGCHFIIVRSICFKPFAW